MAIASIPPTDNFGSVIIKLANKSNIKNLEWFVDRF